MKIKVYSSGSHGNFYTIEDTKNGEKQILLLEAGMNIKEIKKALNFNFKQVVGCVVSHSHNDHAQSLRKLLEIGIPVASNPYVMKDIDHHKKFVLQEKKSVKIGDYKIVPFKLFHDVLNYGFFIKTPSGKRIMFATDTQFIRTFIKDIDVYMVECNFDEHSMRKAIKSGRIDPSILIRVSGTHMSLETLENYFESADLKNTKKIMLIHLSNENSNEIKYINKIEKLTGIETVVADKGIEIKLEDGPDF
jgi:phosphoribosyl 1,2-cyclic phosphodiesterase